jgi:hypothetical protein
VVPAFQIAVSEPTTRYAVPGDTAAREKESGNKPGRTKPKTQSVKGGVKSGIFTTSQLAGFAGLKAIVRYRLCGEFLLMLSFWQPHSEAELLIVPDRGAI